MNTITSLIMLLGSAVGLLAAVGLYKFKSPASRFHSAGKASPIAFVITAIGAAPRLGWGGTAMLILAAAAMILTLPVGVHLLFRAVHRTDGFGPDPT